MELVREKEEKVQPLNKVEESAFEKVKKDKAQEELNTLFDRVKSIKSVIENPEFYDIFIKPIQGNIDSIKNDLETAEKTRDIVLKQGALFAYRKMLHFPETAVEAFNIKLDDLKKNMPLFLQNNKFARTISVKFDRIEYRITIKGGKK